jgi:hypothetical protein
MSTILSLPFFQECQECVILSRTLDNRKILKKIMLNFHPSIHPSFALFFRHQQKISLPYDHKPQQRLNFR